MISVHNMGSVDNDHKKSVNMDKSINTEPRKKWRWKDHITEILLFIIAVETIVLYLIYTHTNISGIFFWSVAGIFCLAVGSGFMCYFIDIIVDGRFKIVEEEAIKDIIFKMSDENRAVERYKPFMRTDVSSLEQDEAKLGYKVYYYPKN